MPEETTTRYALCVEKVQDPNCNWVRIGPTKEVDPDEYMNEREAKRQVAREIWEEAPETPDEIVGKFAVYEVDEPDVFEQRSITGHTVEGSK